VKNIKQSNRSFENFFPPNLERVGFQIFYWLFTCKRVLLSLRGTQGISLFLSRFLGWSKELL
jgi:hypothetical protein